MSPADPWMHIEFVWVCKFWFNDKIWRNETISMNLPLCICFSVRIAWRSRHAWRTPPFTHEQGTKWVKSAGSLQVWKSARFQRNVWTKALSSETGDSNVWIYQKSTESCNQRICSLWWTNALLPIFDSLNLYHEVVVSLKVAVPMHRFQQRKELASPPAKTVQHGNRTCFGTSGIKFLMLPQQL